MAIATPMGVGPYEGHLLGLALATQKKTVCPGARWPKWPQFFGRKSFGSMRKILIGLFFS